MERFAPKTNTYLACGGGRFSTVQEISTDNIFSFFTEISLFVGSVKERTILIEPD